MLVALVYYAEISEPNTILLNQISLRNPVAILCSFHAPFFYIFMSIIILIMMLTINYYSIKVHDDKRCINCEFIIIIRQTTKILHKT